jgi:DNA-directed RNA polymerase specialized sigma24 family protein
VVKDSESDAISIEAAMAGILALLAADREERVSGKPPSLKTELIFVGAGLTIGQAAKILGKNYQTVQKTIYRSKDKVQPEGQA